MKTSRVRDTLNEEDTMAAKKPNPFAKKGDKKKMDDEKDAKKKGKKGAKPKPWGKY